MSTHPVTLEKLQANFGLEGMLKIVAGRGGLTCIQVTNRHAQAEIYLTGAHVTHYQPTGQEPVLFLSKQSLFEPGKPIRGGVPICWPWFGPHASNPSLPMHGFARISEWTLVAVGERADGSTMVELRLQSSPATKALWPHEFELYYTVTVGPQLFLELTYLRVGDIRQIEIRGLEGALYADKTQQMVRKVQPNEPLKFTGRVDRPYLNHSAICEVHDAAWKRRVRVSKEGSHTTVVWNPWNEVAKTLADFGDDEWVEMVCIEAANALDNTVTLPGGQSHIIRTTIGVE